MGETFDDPDVTREAWSRLHPKEDLAVFDIAIRIQCLAALLAARYDAAVKTHGFAAYGDYSVCAAVRRNGHGTTPSALADELLVTRAGMTGRLSRLHGAGFIERHTSEQDARSLNIRLTPLGRRRVDATFSSLQVERTQALASLTTGQQEQLATLLRAALTEDEPS
ncbi:MarR family winged helix-turn-helix transcriptional regulator [Candidatus Poriferisocius sp.]|uniref:MarR family winged helix-turn-helix transcriptional regulator n=1 Tax=Candidatus Poriferisocius sp. TaxID=3101276 RepID=UPI003B5B29B6